MVTLPATLYIACVLVVISIDVDAQECTPQESEIWFNTLAGANTNKLYSVRLGPDANVLGWSYKGTIPRVNGGTATDNYGDIGFDQNGNLFAIQSNTSTAQTAVVQINPGNGNWVGTPFTGYNLSDPTGLTFDRLGNMYSNRSENIPSTAQTSTIHKVPRPGTTPSTPLWIDFSNVSPPYPVMGGVPGIVTNSRFGTDADGNGATLAGDILFYGDKAYAAVYVRKDASGTVVPFAQKFQLIEMGINGTTNAYVGGSMVNLSKIHGNYLPANTYGLAADAYGRVYAFATTINNKPAMYRINLQNGATSLVIEFDIPAEQVFGASGKSEANLDFRPRISQITPGTTVCSANGNITAQQFTITASHYTGAALEYSFNGGLTWQDANTGNVATQTATLLARVKNPVGCAAAEAVTTQVGNSCTPLTDTDGDGIADSNDLDADNDGILNTEEGYSSGSPTTSRDTDGDGIPDYLDLDSDDDGISDLIENGNLLSLVADVNGDGCFSTADGSGYGSGVGSNGVLNSIEIGGPDTGIVKDPVDTDTDGVTDYLDLDSDNDGINDVIEGHTGGASFATSGGRITGADLDGDGIKDAVDSNTAVGSPIGGAPVAASIPDTDGDGVKDFRDLDSDNDGISDVVEAGGLDPDGNGLAGTGTPTVFPSGIPVSGGNLTPPDTDGDGARNYRDLDSDNDGKSDLIESGNPGASADADNDGTISPTESPVGNNGVPAALEGGSEGGAIPQPQNSGPNTSDTADYVNIRSDGTNYDILSTPFSSFDSNSDGKIDNAADADSDGIADEVDSKPGVFGGLGAYLIAAPKAIFQADYNIGTGMMRTTLAESGHLPLTFLSVTRNDVNTLTVGTRRVVDWVKVELRNATSYAVIDKKAGLVLSDGSIVDPVSLSTFFFDQDPGLYILAVVHRNHLAVGMKATLQAGVLAAVDYTDANASTTSQVAVNGKKMMWPGDVNSDGEINATDLSIMTSDLDLGWFDGYFVSDLNFDTEVNATDYSIMFVPFQIGPFYDLTDL